MKIVFDVRGGCDFQNSEITGFFKKFLSTKTEIARHLANLTAVGEKGDWFGYLHTTNQNERIRCRC